MKSDIRSFARRFIPAGLYQKLSFLADVLALLRKEGVRNCITIKSNNGEVVTLKLNSLRHPFTIRRIQSHAGGIIQNVLRGEYDAYPPIDEPEFIIDAGAFIGDLTCHWATRYPEAMIIALEPNPDNYSYALRNTLPYAAKVKLLNQGLWSVSGKLGVTGDEMCSRLVESTDSMGEIVEVVDIPSLISRYSLPRIDILKLDIEGAERQVLNAESARWLPMVKLAIVEMHGPGTETEIVRHMTQQGFEARRCRSLIFFSR
jgi:FkbM family methyltransferase